MLPISTYAETSGTYVNAEGGWQSFRGAVTPAGDARPGWKVLRVLGNLLNQNGFEYNSSEEIKDELQQATSGVQPGIRLNGVAAELATPVGGLIRVGDVPMYAGDALVRRAGALQRTKDARDSIAVRINASVASQNGLADGDSVAVMQGENRATLPLKIDPRVPDGCVQVSAGMPGSETLGSQFGEVTLEKV
jgi:NADH-quinone oxidoreductase subunit G